MNKLNIGDIVNFATIFEIGNDDIKFILKNFNDPIPEYDDTYITTNLTGIVYKDTPFRLDIPISYPYWKNLNPEITIIDDNLFSVNSSLFGIDIKNRNLFGMNIDQYLKGALLYKVNDDYYISLSSYYHMFIIDKDLKDTSGVRNIKSFDDSRYYGYFNPEESEYIFKHGGLQYVKDGEIYRLFDGNKYYLVRQLYPSMLANYNDMIKETGFVILNGVIIDLNNKMVYKIQDMSDDIKETICSDYMDIDVTQEANIEMWDVLKYVPLTKDMDLFFLMVDTSFSEDNEYVDLWGFSVILVEIDYENNTIRYLTRILTNSYAVAEYLDIKNKKYDVHIYNKKYNVVLDIDVFNTDKKTILNKLSILFKDHFLEEPIEVDLLESQSIFDYPLETEYNDEILSVIDKTNSLIEDIKVNNLNITYNDDVVSDYIYIYQYPGYKNDLIFSNQSDIFDNTIDYVDFVYNTYSSNFVSNTYSSSFGLETPLISTSCPYLIDEIDNIHLDNFDFLFSITDTTMGYSRDAHYVIKLNFCSDSIRPEIKTYKVSEDFDFSNITKFQPKSIEYVFSKSEDFDIDITDKNTYVTYKMFDENYDKYMNSYFFGPMANVKFDDGDRILFSNMYLSLRVDYPGMFFDENMVYNSDNANYTMSIDN